MKPIKHALWIALLLSACGGNPFLPDGDGEGNGPPGTEGPVGNAGSALTRTEKTVKTAGKDLGNGFAEGFVLNANDPDDPDDDTFTVDNLAFDGDNEYQRGTTVSEIGPFQVYESDSTFPDPDTGVDVEQYVYRAIYGASADGKTSFAIVRTGSYIPFGFGGFVYKRNGGVTLPTAAGQTTATGRYAGIRDFSGRVGLEYTEGDMNIDIDFKDFNEGKGVKGRVTNRKIFDINGLEITDEVIAAIEAEYTVSLDNALPTLVLATGPGALQATGEASGTLSSQVGTEQFEAGKYYALLADTDALNAGQIVGIFVIESKDPREGFDNIITRETGGFILYRSE